MLGLSKAARAAWQAPARSNVLYGSKDQASTETNRGHLQTASAGKIPGQAGVGGRVYRRDRGPPKSCDLTRWAQFTDIKDIKKEMLHRLEIRFENWLNP